MAKSPSERGRLGLINFSHSDPLEAMLDPLFQITRDVPSVLLEEVLSGKLDYAMVSLLSYYSRRSELKILEGPTIHSISRTMSTLLVSNGGGMDGIGDVAVTSHTQTTEFYLGLILHELGISWKPIRCDFTEASDLLGVADYALLIGDEALRSYRPEFRILIDVGKEFSSLAGLPPVYAVTVSKIQGKSDRLADSDDMARLEPRYDDAAVVRTSMRIGVSPEIVRQYYRCIRYSYDQQVRASIGFALDRFNRQFP